MTIAADANLFLYAANTASVYHSTASNFFRSYASSHDFVVCELVLVELYMLLRNPAVMAKPLKSQEAAQFCRHLRMNSRWQYVDYEPAVSESLWHWAKITTSGFRSIIDARLALTLRHHGVTEFATANEKDFRDFGFENVWNPIKCQK